MIGPMTPDDLAAMFDLARELGLAAADRALPHAGRARATLKSDKSLVTQLDHDIQAMIVQAIRERFPDHAVIGEESLPADADRPAPIDARFCWVIDPLDGTRNFVNGVPCFGTSIAVLDRAAPVVGLIVEHNRRNVYAAIAGEGATLNGEPIQCADPAPGRDTLVGLTSNRDALTKALLSTYFGERGIVLRNLGSTAVHLALVACGAFAADVCRPCKIWDIAAGALLVIEAGGRITVPTGEPRVPFDLSSDPMTRLPILAGTPGTHERLLAVLSEAETQ